MQRVDGERFLAPVRALCGLPDGEVSPAAASDVLEELGGSLTWGEAQNLADCPPRPIAERARSATTLVEGTARFSAPAFVSRVAEREGLSQTDARRLVAAVLTALREQLPAVRFGHLTEELTRSTGLLQEADAHRSS